MTRLSTFLALALTAALVLTLPALTQAASSTAPLRTATPHNATDASAHTHDAQMADIEAAVAEAGRAPGLAEAIASALAEDAKLTASDAAAGDYFGISVALSGDVALVGAGSVQGSGSAYVFRYDGTQPVGSQWAQDAKLTASDAASGDRFGFSVALSGDVALVGAPDDDGYSGSAYVFHYNGTQPVGSQWAQDAKLTASDAASGDRFGSSVALSGDVALVGAYGDDDAASNSGSAYVFELATCGATCNETTKLTASDAAAFDNFGVSVALSGAVALVGAPYDDDDAASNSGSAYVFELATCGATCNETTKLTASDAAALDYFGASVALSGDRALVGAYGDDDAGASSGSAYVFELATCGATCNETTKLTASDPAAYDGFGFSVALSGDLALVAAPYDDDAVSNSGSAYVFELATCGATCNETTKLTASDPAADDNFGYSVSLSGDRALVGALFDGSAYTFELTTNTPPVITEVVMPIAPAAVGAEVAVSAPFTDPDAGDTHTCAIDYGDGTAVEAGTVDGLTCVGTHAYSEAGIYTVAVTVTDAAGESDIEAATAFVVVYDPTAGFVTGGGWIGSPEGAYVPAPTLAGRASFGFVAKYKKGRSTPDGNTQFKFNAAGLSFRSTTYDWLVIAGANAKFKGIGTINGAGDFGFMLTATDGDPDQFRIKIWDRDAGDGVVYDNKRGESDDSNEGTALGGGQIMIHRQGGSAAIGDDPFASATLNAEAAFGLAAPYPNPSTGRATLAFSVEDATDVRLAVYDALGREVAVLLDGAVSAGRHERTLDGAELVAGTYLVRLTTADGRVATHRLTRLR